MRDYNIYENISLNNEGYYVAPINEVEREDAKFFRQFCFIYSNQKTGDLINIHKKLTCQMFGYLISFLNREDHSIFDVVLKGLLSMAARVASEDLTRFSSNEFERFGFSSISGVYELLKNEFLKIEDGELVFSNNYLNTAPSYSHESKSFRNLSVLYSSAFSILENEDNSKYVHLDSRSFYYQPNILTMKVALFKCKDQTPYDVIRGGFKLLSDLGFPKSNKAKNGLSVGGYSLEIINFLEFLYSTILEVLDSDYFRTGVYTEEEYKKLFHKIEQLLVRIKFSWLKYEELRDLKYSENNNFYTLVKRTSFDSQIPILNFSYHVCNWIKECLEEKEELFNVCEISEDYFSKLLIHTLFDMVRLTYNDDIQNLEFLEAKNIVSNSIKNYVLSFRFIEEDGFTKVLFEDRTINNNLRTYFNKLFPNVDFTQDVLEFIMQGLIRTRFEFFTFKPNEFRCFLKQDIENKKVFLYFYLDAVK